MSNSQKPKTTDYHPLLPKMKDFGGSIAAGEWTIGEKSLFGDIANNLDFDTAKYTEINSIPSPWSKSLQFMSAMRETNYPSSPRRKFGCYKI